MEKILKKLKDDKHYYGKLGKKYLSNSDIMALLNDPKNFGVEKEMTKAMLLGRYFHTAMLEPHKLDSTEYWSIDASSRNTKKYKEELAQYDSPLMMLLKEREEINKAIYTMKNNLFFYENIYAEGNQFEVPAIHKVRGLEWKGKADVVGKDFLIDLKTTSNLKDFKYSARKYNYDSQAYLYQQFFNKPLLFYVVDKLTLQIGIFTPSSDFIMRGKEKVERAVEVYNTFFSESATSDIENYIHHETI